ncbi:GroES-like protein [Ostertagia ostertagi]
MRLRCPLLDPWGNWKFVVEEPMVLGHETSGTVVAVGSVAEGFAVGDRVAIEPGVPCRMCTHCKVSTFMWSFQSSHERRAGTILCGDMRFFATPPIDGSLARYVAYDADFCYKLPDHVTFEGRSPFGATFCGRTYLSKIWCSDGTTCSGTRSRPYWDSLYDDSKNVGCCLKWSSLILTRIASTWLKNWELSIRYVLSTGKSPAEVREAVIESLGTEPDVALECTGAQSSIESAILTTRSGGVVVLVGLGASRIELPVVEAAVREVDLRGVFRYVNWYVYLSEFRIRFKWRNYPTALNLVASRKIDLSGLTRARYPLEDTLNAFKRAQKADVIKVFINCDKW